jgi:hypothetical protein
VSADHRLAPTLEAGRGDPGGALTGGEFRVDPEGLKLNCLRMHLIVRRPLTYHLLRTLVCVCGCR